MDKKRIIKASLPPHYGVVHNALGFDQAFNAASETPERTYQTTGNDTPFTITASLAKRGRHPNERVLRFMSGGSEKARAYECCWGHKTNCSKTHIDCYTQAIKP